MILIDTHSHIDGEEFDNDREQVLGRAMSSDVRLIFVPAIDLPSSQRILQLCNDAPRLCPDGPRLYPMTGLHPEEVKADWRDQLAQISSLIHPTSGPKPIAIGEVGLDFYWSREFEQEQQEAFEEQVRWSVETRLPLMIHCRKAQNEMVRILKRYAHELPGGVFHCFTGNAIEAEELLQFEGFVLGIGGVLTFKKSPLPEVLPKTVPLSRIVIETDSPYMAPVPKRGQRNEPAYVAYVAQRLAEAYGVSIGEVARQTTETALRTFTIEPPRL